MGVNPLTEKGIPLGKQLRNRPELNVQPYGMDLALIAGSEDERVRRAQQSCSQTLLAQMTAGGPAGGADWQ